MKNEKLIFREKKKPFHKKFSSPFRPKAFLDAHEINDQSAITAASNMCCAQCTVNRITNKQL